MIDSTSENPDGLSTPPCKNRFSRREGVMFINSLFSFHVTFCLCFIKRRNIIY
jgi:hypothetical protein